ncbi:MAG: hypothetical protein K6G16_02860 [Lachnospiraceae bacterium]|nr:hypothetical protein [Lachnospiraceae bacterium]
MDVFGFHKSAGSEKRRAARAVIIGILCVLLLGGCGAKTQRWAYIHEPDKEILSLSSDGKAVFKDVKYTYTKDDSRITLTDASGNAEDHRYYMDGDQMVFYERSVYTLDEGTAGDGIVGVWKNGKSEYEFTAKGTFNEDNAFFGHYEVDEQAGTIQFMYDAPLQDALLYYELDSDGKQLTIDYPWPMMECPAK